MRIAYCHPAYRKQVHVGHVAQAAGFSVLAAQKGIALMFADADSPSIDWARNYLLNQAVKHGADWCLMMDADTYVHDPSELLRMVVEGHERRAAVIGAPVLIRNRISYMVEKDGAQLEREAFTGQVLEVDRLGTSLIAIRCGFIAKSWSTGPWFQQRQTHEPGKDPGFYGEDYGFCDGVRERGGRVWLDGRFEPVHAGTSAGVGKFLDVTRQEDTRQS